MLFTREQLHFRHQLSHQQIDDFLGEQKSSGFPESKAASLSKLKHFFILLDIFEEHNVKYIALKGPVLSSKIYNDPTYRTIGDFDFLLDFNHIGSAVTVLRNHGYEARDWPDNKKSVKQKKRYRNQILLEHPGTGVLVELHWRLLGISPVSNQKTEELVKNNLSETVFFGRKILTLNQDMELLFLVIHGGHHNWFRLKWLEDVHQIAGKGMYDPQKFKLLTNSFKARRMVNLCNALLKYYYPGSKTLPGFGKTSEFAVNFTKSRISSNINRPYESISELLKYTLFLFNSFPGFGFKTKVIQFILYSFTNEGMQSPSSTFRNLLLQPFSLIKNRYRLQN